MQPRSFLVESCFPRSYERGYGARPSGAHFHMRLLPAAWRVGFNPD